MGRAGAFGSSVSDVRWTTQCWTACTCTHTRTHTQSYTHTHTHLTQGEGAWRHFKGHYFLLSPNSL
uniref:Uncharacterized protein n=1 Tax=Anguilla anguilla TaxID=7936 RepID=A0A0E9SEB5_ANGAN